MLIMLVLLMLLLAPYDYHSVGMATYYTYTQYGENHLYCSGRTAVDGVELRYTQQLMRDYNWVAVDVRAYKDGSVRCGDTLRICFDNELCIDAYAWDAGPFEKYYIEEHPDLPILVDFEESAWPFDNDVGSAIVDVYVLEALEYEDHNPNKGTPRDYKDPQHIR